MEIQELELVDNELAERAAMGKVVDIYHAPFLKHTFLRFPSTDPRDFQTKHEHWYGVDRSQIDPSIDRLEQSLKKGLVSDAFAERAGIKLSKNWTDPMNIDNVSLYGLGTDLNHVVKHQVVGVDGWKRNGDNNIVLLVDPSVKVDDRVGAGYEVYRKFRVRPKNLKGIVIMDDIRLLLTLGQRSNGVSNSVLHPEKNAQDVVEVQKRVFGNNYDLYIPIYGNSGDLLWPTQLTRQEIVDHLKVKERLWV